MASSHLLTVRYPALLKAITVACAVAGLAVLHPAAAQSPGSSEETPVSEVRPEASDGPAVGVAAGQVSNLPTKEELGEFASKTGFGSGRIKAGSPDATLVYIDTFGAARSGPEVAAQFSRAERKLPAKLPADVTFREAEAIDELPSMVASDLAAVDEILDRQANLSPLGHPVEGTLLTRDSRIVEIERFATVPRDALVDRLAELSDRLPDRAESVILNSVGDHEILFAADLEVAALRLVREGDLPRDVADELLDLPYVWRIVGRPTGGMVPPAVTDFGRPPGFHEPRMIIAEPVYPLPLPPAPEPFPRIADNRGTVVEFCGQDQADPVTHCALSTVMLMHGGFPICSGVLVSNAHVLTAAHCVCPGQVGETSGDPSEIRIAVGNARGDLFLRVDEDDPVSIYHGPFSGVGPCSTWGMEDPLRWGDVAILHIDPESYDEVRTELTNSGAETHAEADKMKAKIGEMDDADWNRNIGETFAFYGFGTGPHGQDGVKRADMITLNQAATCNGEPTCIGPPAVQEAIFHDDHIGLCASDSGGGVFKPVATPRAGFGRWAVVGILSGGPGTSACHSPDNVLFAVQEERYFVRLDAPGISGWLDGILGPAADRVSVTDFYPVEVADADQ